LYKRFNEPQKLPLLADIPIAKFKARQVLTLGNLKLTNIKFSTPEIGYQIEIHDSGQRFIVNLEETKCDCGDFYEYQSPCSYAICAARYEVKDP
jgi:hypothetical protein